VVLLTVDELSKRFGGVTAVSKVSFEIEEGEILGLIGPNGSGKSTLFGLLSGMLTPTSGRIFYQGANVTRWAPHRRCHHGLVQTFQLAQAFPDLSVEKNVQVGAVFGARRRRAHDFPRLSVEEVLQLTDLADRRSARSNELTLAGRKRLEVARALAASPRLLLLDEVMAGLNPSELAEVVEVIRRIHARGITLIVTEHVVESLFQLVHRILVLHHGQLLFNGDVRAASQDPKVIEAYLGRAYTPDAAPA
jgi:branched-chain amino acid transport system ATP-binding protein